MSLLDKLQLFENAHFTHSLTHSPVLHSVELISDERDIEMDALLKFQQGIIRRVLLSSPSS